MLLAINIILVAGALVLVLVIAATASIPSRHQRGADSFEGNWIRPTGSPGGANSREPVAERTALPPEVAAAGMQ